MKFEIDRKDFLPALAQVGGAVERRHTLPILANLLLKTGQDTLEIVGSDLEVQIGSRAAALIIEEGATTVPAKKLFDICRNLPEEARISFTQAGDRTTLTSGRGRFLLGTLPAADYPVLEQPVADVRISLSQGDLKTLFEKAGLAMANQDVRYYLNGLLIEIGEAGIRCVATDGHRLAKVDKKLDAGLDTSYSAIVPHKTVVEVKRLLDSSDGTVDLSLTEKALSLVFNGTQVVSKLVDGKYPDYERVIPRGLDQRAVVEKHALRRALVRTSVLSNEKYRGVQFSFEDGLLRLRAHNPEQEEAVDEVALDYSGLVTSMGFNVTYVLDVLNALDDEAVEIVFGEEGRSSIWKNLGKDEESFVIMPMRL